ncbi:toll/interleukin-1 receptor domain-containing protein [Parvibaculum sp.]|uniref:toll/interleukin-1 receptor domain-containing protein n=1 Tax=Parvibaculum sp. TaxID=2024848 RepID=UPI003919C07C
MGTLTEANIRERGLREAGPRPPRALLNESVRDFAKHRTYDIFLSHSVRDDTLVLGVKAWLEDQNRTVYVDWIDDPQLDRSKVTPSTAEMLRQRMDRCESLIYLHSENSGTSKWMPWELGYFDGKSGAVAILPVTKTEQTNFSGQEYLGIYPWIDQGSLDLYGSESRMRVHKSSSDYKGWSEWTRQPKSFRKTV